MIVERKPPPLEYEEIEIESKDISESLYEFITIL